MKTGIVSMDYWNNTIMPLVESKKIKERRDLVKRGFLVIYQVFHSVIQEDNALFSVSAWNIPGMEPYVEIVRI